MLYRTVVEGEDATQKVVNVLVEAAAYYFGIIFALFGVFAG